MKIILEPIKVTRARLQKEHPTAKITYLKGQWRIAYPLPKDFLRLKSIEILPKEKKNQAKI